MGNVKSTATNTHHHFTTTTIVTTEDDTVSGGFSLPVITPLPPIEDVVTWTSSSTSPHPNATTFVNHITDIVSKQVESSLKVSTTREPSITSDDSEDSRSVSLPDANSSSASVVDEDVSASIHTFGPSLSCCDGASPRRQFRNSQISKANNYISCALLDNTNRTRNKELITTITESDTHHSHSPSGDSLVDPWLLLGAAMPQKQSDNGRSSDTSFLSYSTKRSSSGATSINTDESCWCPSTSNSFVPNSPLLTESQSPSQASDQPSTRTSIEELLEAESPLSTKECVICAEKLPASSFEKVTSHCSHEQNVCDGCVGRHISSELANKGNFRIQCPSEVECWNILEDTDVKKFASQEDHDRYQRLSVRAAISQIPDFHYCSNPKCDSGQIHYEGAHAPIMNCTACGQKSCIIHDLPIYPGTGGCARCEKVAASSSVTSRISGFFSNLALPSSSSSSPSSPPSSVEPGCSTLSTPPPTSVSTSSLSRYSLFGKRDLSGLTLEQYAEKQRRKSDAKKEARRQKKISKEEQKSEKFVSTKAKSCPRCSSKIIKKGGCDHMTCQAPGCGYEFCWLCMADYRTVLEQGNQEHRPFCKYHK